MKPFQERVVVEKRELDEKISKLKSFIGSDTYRDVHFNERSRLERQLWFMQDYSKILGERIENFN